MTNFGLNTKYHATSDRPALLYYGGRVLYGNADYANSVKMMGRWIAHRVAKGLPVAPPLKESADEIDLRGVTP